MPGDYFRLAIEETPRYEGVQQQAPYRISTVPLYLPVQTARIAPGPQFEDRSDEARNIEGGVSQIVETFEPEGAIAMRAYVNSMIFLLHLCGYQGVRTPGAAGGTDEVQTLTITGGPTGGSYTLTWISPEGVTETTLPIPWNATPAQVDAALEALRTIPAGSLTCAGGPHPATPITVTFSGGGLEKRNVNQLTATGTGLTPTGTVTPTTTTAGVAGAVTDPDGRSIPVGCDKWVFDKRGGTTAKTATMWAAYADELVHLMGSGYAVSQIGLNAEGALTCELMGLVMENVADPAFTPAFDLSAIRHQMRADLWLSWLTGGGVAGDFSLQITNPLRRVWTLGLAPASRFANEMLHGDERVRITGAIPKEILDDDDINTLMAGTTFTAKARWQSSYGDNLIGATTYPYSMWCELPKAQYLGFAPDDVANRRRFGGNFDFWAAWDEASGYDSRFTLVGSVPALETYV